MVVRESVGHCSTVLVTLHRIALYTYWYTFPWPPSNTNASSMYLSSSRPLESIERVGLVGGGGGGGAAMVELTVPAPPPAPPVVVVLMPVLPAEPGVPVATVAELLRTEPFTEPV